ncbi:MAG: hypothetical protein ACI8RN_002335 [Glaciecola sp.]|jgi:hypothetical protein
MDDKDIEADDKDTEADGKDIEANSDSGHEKSSLSLKELSIIILSGHLGVRKRVHRENDFARANGLHVILAAAFYFALLVSGLIALVIFIAD